MFFLLAVAKAKRYDEIDELIKETEKGISANKVTFPPIFNSIDVVKQSEHLDRELQKIIKQHTQST